MGHEYSERSRTLVLALLAPVFLVALPALFISLGGWIDEQMGWPPVPAPPLQLIIGIPLVLAGAGLGLWSNHRLFTTGRGTPLPVMPTQELIVEPPYTLSRNPMALGAIALYLGVSALARSWGAALLVLLCAAALLCYIKFVEERGLVARFGDPYVEYRGRTPFLVPRRPSRRP